MWEFFRDSHDSETDGHKRDLVNGDWKFSLATNATLLTLRPHRRRTSTASTAAHRPSESKSKLKSSSKRITSSKYTLTTGSFPEQGAKQITDNRYAERTTQSVRELWENTTISTGHLLNNTKKTPMHHTKSRWQRSTFPYFSNEVACSWKSGSPYSIPRILSGKLQLCWRVKNVFVISFFCLF